MRQKVAVWKILLLRDFIQAAAQLLYGNQLLRGPNGCCAAARSSCYLKQELVH
jgi:hypothetical protein